MAKIRFRLAVQAALRDGLGPAQIQTIAMEECVDEVDYGYGPDDTPAVSVESTNITHSSTHPITHPVTHPIIE